MAIDPAGNVGIGTALIPGFTESTLAFGSTIGSYPSRPSMAPATASQTRIRAVSPQQSGTPPPQPPSTRRTSLWSKDDIPVAGVMHLDQEGRPLLKCCTVTPISTHGCLVRSQTERTGLGND
jgi:hypothetical protein